MFQAIKIIVFVAFCIALTFATIIGIAFACISLNLPYWLFWILAIIVPSAVNYGAVWLLVEIEGYYWVHIKKHKGYEFEDKP